MALSWGWGSVLDAFRKESAMGMGKRRRESQEELFITTGELAKSPGHAFYKRLNKLLSE